MKISKCILAAVAALVLASCNGNKTEIVAHRGFWNCEQAGFSQNSIASLKAAQDCGFWGSEFDVHLTSDDVVVVHHDQTADGIDIQANPFDSLRACRLANGETIPTLDEYLTQGEKSTSTILVLELKPESSPEREDRLVEICLESLKAHGLYSPERVMFISFSLHMCEVLVKECPEFTVQYLNGELSPEELKAKDIDGFDYEDSIVTEEMVKEAHRLGLSTNVWTVNDSTELQRFADMGIGAITTNEPLLLRRILSRK